MKTRTSKTMGAAAAFAAIAASGPLAITAYADPEPTPAPVVEIPDPQGSGCDAFKQAVPNFKSLSTLPVSKALASIPDLSTFNAAISGGLNPAVNIVSVIDGGPYVVFAPTNDAFAKLRRGDAGAAQGRSGAADVDAASTTWCSATSAPTTCTARCPPSRAAAVNVTGKGGDIKINDTVKVVCSYTAAGAYIYMIDTVLSPGDAPEPLDPDGQQHHDDHDHNDDRPPPTTAADDLPTPRRRRPRPRRQAG